MKNHIWFISLTGLIFIGLLKLSKNIEGNRSFQETFQMVSTSSHTINSGVKTFCNSDVNLTKTPSLIIISKEIYESEYKENTPFIHIIRLKKLNMDKDISSMEESVETLQQLNYPTSPTQQAYRLYSGSYLIVNYGI